MSKQSIALLTCEIQGAATCWHWGTELQRKKRSNPRWGMLQWVFFFSTPKEKGRLPLTPLLLSFFLPHFLTPVLGESVFSVVVSFDSPFAFLSSFLSSCHKTKVNRKIVITVSSGAFFYLMQQISCSTRTNCRWNGKKCNKMQGFITLPLRRTIKGRLLYLHNFMANAMMLLKSGFE